jgi:OOP family OmpA-OmpF porin
MTHPGRAPRLFSRLILTLATPCVALPAAAVGLDWPMGAERVAQHQSAVSGYRMATGVHDGSQVPTATVSGTLIDEVWTIPGDLGDPALLMATLSEQLTAQGYAIGFACADAACGGFDFRFALPIAEGPEMHVDLGRFQYLTATRVSADGAEHVALTLSHGGQLGYAHLARVVPRDSLPAQVTPSSSLDPETAPPTGDLIAELTQRGAAVLTDVSFGTGASALAEGPVDSLVTLAAFLAENASRRIVLVGHTDTEGSREGNIALSRARAMAVRSHLIETLGADPARIEAEGVGYLAPRASNGTPDGREANRRVEVVLIAE